MRKAVVVWSDVVKVVWALCLVLAFILACFGKWQVSIAFSLIALIAALPDIQVNYTFKEITQKEPSIAPPSDEVKVSESVKGEVSES